jgi:hypothetical protein
MKTKLLTLLAPLILITAEPAHAIRFTNQFLEFELPPQWQCNLEGAEWVCQSTVDARKKEAIIVFAAKLKGDQDSLDQYLTYLKAPKTYTSAQGKPVKSEYKNAKTENYNGQPWVDAFHLESELPGFYTRYLATVKEDIGVLVTYSVTKDKWQNYVNDFNAMVQTLKVFRKQGMAINANPQGGSIFDQTKIPQNLTENSVFNEAPQEVADANAQAKSSQGGSDDWMFYGIVILAAAGVLFIIKKRKS